MDSRMSPLEAMFVNISRTALNSMCHVAVSQDEIYIKLLKYIPWHNNGVS